MPGTRKPEHARRPARVRAAANRPPKPAARARDYRLTIGPLSWWMSAGRGLEDWLARLARILELEPLGAAPAPESDEPKIIFLRLDPKAITDDSPGIVGLAASSGWPRSGWLSRWFFPVRFWSHPRIPHLICEVVGDLSHELAIESMSFSCFPIMERIIDLGGLPLHSALVCRSGFGVALSASGGTGKSTSSRRIPSPWRTLCDDTTLVLPGSTTAFEAHPFATWSDYLWKRSEGTWNVAGRIPLKAIFFLKQADKDKASAIGQGETAIYIARSSTEILTPFIRRLEVESARALKGRIFDNACRAAKAVPAYVLDVSLEGQFWEEIERVLD